LEALASFIEQPGLPNALREFIFSCLYPDRTVPPIDQCPEFDGAISVFHSATARFYAPSDLCGAGGMHTETIHANPSWFRTKRYDTVFVGVNDEPGILGMEVARVLLLFSFSYRNTDYECALVNWFDRNSDTPDPTVDLFKVIPDRERVQVIDLDSIVRASHLLPVFGKGLIPMYHFEHTLDAWDGYYVNKYADHHTHELLSS
jgi:hypothetical protein